MKKLYSILTFTLLGVTITSIANNKMVESVAPRASNRKIVDTIKNVSFQKMENGKVLTTNTWERSCAYGGSDYCESGTYTTNIVL